MTTRSKSEEMMPGWRRLQGRYPMAKFLGILGLLLVLLPFMELFPNGDLAEAIVLTLVLGSAVLALGTRRRVVLFGLILASVAITCKWLDQTHPEPWRAWFYAVSSAVFLVTVVTHLLRYVARAPRVNSEVLCAAVAAYLLIGSLWATTYVLVWRVNPASFAFSVPLPADQKMTHFTSIYFSFMTLSTVGYGDVTPVSHVARMLAVVEAVIGMLFVAILISRLVALYTTDSSSED
ncbi:MAG: potassium channel family protein [Verrucomicrobiota bacterium]